MSRVVVAASVLALAACGGHVRAPRPVPLGQLALGVCGEPGQGGVLSSHPQLVHADRDLNGDGEPELVVADRMMCRAGNCYWNVFSSGVVAGCRRFLGTIAANTIDRLGRRGEDGFFDLRGWWSLATGRRYLVQEFGFRRGGYRAVETLLCRQEGDDRLLCAPDWGR